MNHPGSCWSDPKTGSSTKLQINNVQYCRHQEDLASCWKLRIINVVHLDIPYSIPVNWLYCLRMTDNYLPCLFIIMSENVIGYYTAPLGTTNTSNLCSRCTFGGDLNAGSEGLHTVADPRHFKFSIRFNHSLKCGPGSDFSLSCGSGSSSTWCESATTGIQTLQDYILSLHTSLVNGHCPSWLNLKSLKLQNFDFIVGSGSSFPNNADSCGSGIHSRLPPLGPNPEKKNPTY